MLGAPVGVPHVVSDFELLRLGQVVTGHDPVSAPDDLPARTALLHDVRGCRRVSREHRDGRVVVVDEHQPAFFEVGVYAGQALDLLRCGREFLKHPVREHHEPVGAWQPEATHVLGEEPDSVLCGQHFAGNPKPLRRDVEPVDVDPGGGYLPGHPARPAADLKNGAAVLLGNGDEEVGVLAPLGEQVVVLGFTYCGDPGCFEQCARLLCGHGLGRMSRSPRTSASRPILNML